MDYKIYCQLREYVNPKPNKRWIHNFSKNPLPAVAAVIIILVATCLFIGQLQTRNEADCLKIATIKNICH